MVRRLISGAAALASSSVDVAVVRLAQYAGRQSTGPRTEGEQRARLERAVAATAALDLASFYAAPAPISPREEPVTPVSPAARFRAGRTPSGRGELPAVLDLSWPSAFEPAAPELRAKYLAVAENRTARARLFRHLAPSPTVICIHGYGAGQPAFEERAFGAAFLFRLGLDVALLQLPFHAQRRPRQGGVPLFPSSDTARTVQAFGQSVHDLRALAAWLRSRGAPAVGLVGMSLGGYTAALAATVAPFDFLVPFIPLADVTAVHHEHEALRERRIPAELLALGRQALEPVSPLARKPLLAAERTLVIAARHDRITAPATHAARLASHFGARLVWFEGGHLLQLGRRAAFGELARFLGGLGIAR